VEVQKLVRLPACLLIGALHRPGKERPSGLVRWPPFYCLGSQSAPDRFDFCQTRSQSDALRNARSWHEHEGLSSSWLSLKGVPASAFPVNVMLCSSSSGRLSSLQNELDKEEKQSRRSASFRAAPAKITPDDKVFKPKLGQVGYALASVPNQLFQDGILHTMGVRGPGNLPV
jgi:hypothetical protein